MLLRFFAFSNVLMLALFASAGPWDNVGGVSPDATNQVLIESKAFTTNAIANLLPIVSTNTVQITGSLSVNGTNVLGAAGGTNVYNTIVTNTYVSNYYSFAVSSTYTGTVVNGMLRIADDAGVYRASGQWESPTITSASGFTGLTMSVLSQYGGANNSPAETPASASGLVAYYKLNGSAIDSVTGSNGTIAGNASFTNVAVIGSSSITLDGSGDYATLYNTGLLNGSTGLTYSCWVSGSYQLYDGVIFSRSTPGGNGLRMDEGNSISLLVNDVRISTSPFVTSSWMLLTSTWSTGGVGRIYVNGVLSSTNSISYIGLLSNSAAFRAGSDSIGSRDFNGSIDDVQIYNRPLSDSEIYALYANSSAHRTQVSLNGGAFVGPDSTTNSYYTGSTAFGATQTQAKVRVELSKSSVSNTTPRIYNLAMLNIGGGATVFDTVADFAQGTFTNTLVDTEPAFPTNMAYVSDVVAATSGAASVVYVTNAVAVATNSLYTNSIEWTYVLTTNTYDWTEANLLHDGTNYCLPLPAHIPADAKEVGVMFIAAQTTPAAGQGLTIQEKWATYSNTPTAYFPRMPCFPKVSGLTDTAYVEIPVVDRSISYRSNIPAAGRTASIKIIKYRR